jgi:hypothetical protein
MAICLNFSTASIIDVDRIAQRVSDRRLLALVRRMLRAGVVIPDGTISPILSG